LKEILPRLLSGKAIGKLGMKASELLNKLANVLFSDQQLGYGKTPVLHEAFWMSQLYNSLCIVVGLIMINLR
jgi:hypothetical protein